MTKQCGQEDAGGRRRGGEDGKREVKIGKGKEGGKEGGQQKVKKGRRKANEGANKGRKERR